MNIKTLSSSISIMTFVVLVVVASLLLINGSVFAQSLAEQAQEGVDAVGDPQNTRSAEEVIIDVINILLFVVGILSVLMIIIGGIRYVVSAGDSNAAQGARNTILYAIIGLVIAFVAWGIVNFVTNVLIGNP